MAECWGPLRHSGPLVDPLPKVPKPVARSGVRSLAPLKRPYRPSWWVGGISKATAEPAQTPSSKKDRSRVKKHVIKFRHTFEQRHCSCHQFNLPGGSRRRGPNAAAC